MDEGWLMVGRRAGFNHLMDLDAGEQEVLALALVEGAGEADAIDYRFRSDRRLVSGGRQSGSRSIFTAGSGALKVWSYFSTNSKLV